MKTKAVVFKNISMRFPGILANNNVSLEINKGEIFALVGENGAGKSTLMNILYGLHTPSKGEIFVFGEKFKNFSPSNSLSFGVGMVHQHFMLVDSFSVAQNIVLAKEPLKNNLFCDSKKSIQICEALAKQYHFKINPKEIVENLSVGEKQRVEILKTLYRGAKILILDEPTAVLTPNETQEFFQTIKNIVATQHMTIIIITHKLYEVMELSSRVGIMRNGVLVDVVETKNASQKTLASLMVGREVRSSNYQKAVPTNKTAITIKNLFVKNSRNLEAVRNLSLTIKYGEIHGIAGVDGNGQSELVEAICALKKITAGEIIISNTNIKNLTPKKVRLLGVAHIPEDRMKTGLCLNANIADNLIIGKHKKNEFSILKIQQRKKNIKAYTQKIFEKFDIRAANSEVLAISLSGGNMQKIVVARELMFNSKILIVSQPTRGVDIGAIEQIHSQLVARRNEGCAILLVSADLDELFSLCDRISAMYNGNITATLDASKTDKSQIGLYMAGGK